MTRSAVRCVPMFLAAVLAPLAPVASQAQLVASGGAAGDLFGGGSAAATFAGGPGVALDGDVLVVGAYLDDVDGRIDQGSATVFRWDGAKWVEEQTLVAAGGAAGDWFGSSVSVSGNAIVVGAPHTDVGGFVERGAASVFRWDGASWIEEQALPYGGSGFDWFGTSVSVHGGVALVGAPLDVGLGSASVYRFDGAAWQPEATLYAADAADSDFFGGSVSVWGDTALVGAVLDDVGPTPFAGSGTVFRFDGAQWFQEQQLLASDGALGDFLGSSVFLRGELAVLGATGRDVDGKSNQGSACVFRLDGGVWEEQQRLVMAAGAKDDDLGGSVGVCGNTIVVGAPGHDPGGVQDAGAAAVFHWNGASWIEQSLFTAGDAAPNDLFGSSVAVHAGRMLAGAPGDDVAGSLDQGSVWLDTVPVGNVWTDQGFALAGVYGDPVLAGSGELVAGCINTLELSNAAPDALAGMFYGLSANPLSFKGGFIVPVPFFDVLLAVTSGSGSIGLTFSMPVGVPPGTELWGQWALLDVVAIKGVAISNAVVGVVP